MLILEHRILFTMHHIILRALEEWKLRRGREEEDKGKNDFLHFISCYYGIISA